MGGFVNLVREAEGTSDDEAEVPYGGVGLSLDVVGELGGAQLPASLVEEYYAIGFLDVFEQLLGFKAFHGVGRGRT